MSLKFSYFLVPISIFIGVILMFVDSRINKKAYTKQEYIKISLLIFVVSTFILYIHNLKGVLDEEIIIGNPPF